MHVTQIRSSDRRLTRSHAFGQAGAKVGGPEHRQLEPTVGLAARNRSTQGGSIGLQNLTTGSSPGRATNNADPPVRGGRMRPTASSCSVSRSAACSRPRWRARKRCAASSCSERWPHAHRRIPAARSASSRNSMRSMFRRRGRQSIHVSSCGMGQATSALSDAVLDFLQTLG